MKLCDAFTLWSNHEETVLLMKLKQAGLTIGVKVPSTSLLSAYTKVLAHNLNGTKN